MGKRKKLNIDVNNIDSLQELMQEIYHDACTQIKESHGVIINLSNSTEPLDTDDFTKIAKAKTDALKVKDSAIKIKLDVGKLQNEIMKKKAELGLPPGAEKITESGEVSLDDFSRIRALIEKDNKTGDA